MTKGERIKELLRSGHTVGEIVSLVGCSRGTVGYHREKLGMTTPQKKHPVSEWGSDYENGMPVHEIASKYHMSLRTIYDAIDRGDIEPRDDIRLTLHLRPIGEVIIDRYKGAHKYQVIRTHARKLYQHLTECENCGWDHHVHVCHVHPISEFPLTATVGEVNTRTNIKILCPNCHWLFDNEGIT